jgi:hypothetical protein
MRRSFKKKDRIRILRWCDRHCCLCEKACGLDIELAHIDLPEDDDINNAIPVCYDCHAKIGMYNDRHPRGTKLSNEELRARREQIYDKYTRQYVPPIRHLITQIIDPWGRGENKREFPDVGLSVMNLSDYLSARLQIALQGILNGNRFDLKLADPLYRGEKTWNLNPRAVVNGWFRIQSNRVKKLKARDRLDIQLIISVTDIVDRQHKLLTNGYVFKCSNSDWYFEP